MSVIAIYRQLMSGPARGVQDGMYRKNVKAAPCEKIPNLLGWWRQRLRVAYQRSQSNQD
jgi:hypothetical protein